MFVKLTFIDIHLSSEEQLMFTPVLLNIKHINFIAEAQIIKLSDMVLSPKMKELAIKQIGPIISSVTVNTANFLVKERVTYIEKFLLRKEDKRNDII